MSTRKQRKSIIEQCEKNGHIMSRWNHRELVSHGYPYGYSKCKKCGMLAFYESKNPVNLYSPYFGKAFSFQCDKEWFKNE